MGDIFKKMSWVSFFVGAAAGGLVILGISQLSFRSALNAGRSSTLLECQVWDWGWIAANQFVVMVPDEFSAKSIVEIVKQFNGVVTDMTAVGKDKKAAMVRVEFEKCLDIAKIREFKTAVRKARASLLEFRAAF